MTLTVTAEVLDAHDTLKATASVSFTVTSAGGARTMLDASIGSIAQVIPLFGTKPAGCSEPATMFLTGPAWTSADIAKIPAGVQIIRVDTTGALWKTADVLDFEQKYVVDVATAAAWVKNKLTLGTYAQVRPTIYAWEGNLTQNAKLIPGLASLGLVLHEHYDIHVADQTGTEHDYPGAVATQWHGYTSVSIDYSHVADPTWHAA